ncbi:MAG TPA: hypothetical protein VFR80_12895 [Pyrinomonadaceae bacterium]|nr:hypothetical protein [Pyrinomonadaceae bacterium]
MDDNSLMAYEAALFANRRVFLLNHSWAYFAYHQLHETFTKLGDVLSKGRNESGKSYIGLLPFLLIMQRQGVNAFLSLSTLQSFQAWVLLRPCLEAALMAGKWVDEPANAIVWRNRETDRKTYRKTYEGTALRSRSLPRSAEIQTVLRIINDDFLHANPRYYYRHTRMDVFDADTVSMKLEYFDEEQDYIPHTFSLLHLICILQNSLAKMFADQIVDRAPVPVGLSNLETTLRPRVNQFLDKHSDRRSLIEELGIWRLNPKSR